MESSTEEGDSTLEVTSKLTLKTGVVQIKDRPVGVLSGAVQAEGQRHRELDGNGFFSVVPELSA